MFSGHRVKLVVLVVLGLMVGAAPSRPAAQAPSATAVFDEVWQTVKDRFYDPTLRGLDWDAVKARYRPAVAAAASDAERARLINAMLGELHASHTGYYTRADRAYYDLADIFSGSLHGGLRRLFPHGEVAYTGIGVLTGEVGGKTFVSGVLGGLPGDKAGLRVGDEIVATGGAPYDAIASFLDRADTPVTLTIRRTADGPTEDLTVVPERIRPSRAYLAAMEASARIVERAGRRIGYIHVWSYAREEYQALLGRQLERGVLKDADALVWDLRDGWGGAQAAYLDMFTARGPLLVLTDRSGKQSVDHVTWRKPVAMLVNGGTRSGKEILAYGFKKYRVGELIGTRTKGDVLAARAFLMADGSLLELAVDDVAVDGERLEGVGVTPTIEVPFDLPYAAGRDPQLDRAVELLAHNPSKIRYSSSYSVIQ